MKTLISGQIGQPDMRNFRRRLTEWDACLTLWKCVEVQIEQGARITDEDDRFRLNTATGNRPEIIVIIQGRSITKRAGVDFPGSDRGEDKDVMTTANASAMVPAGSGAQTPSAGHREFASALVGVRKNSRGSRSRCLKLEINEGIAASLSENDRAHHDGADGGDGPRR